MEMRSNLHPNAAFFLAFSGRLAEGLPFISSISVRRRRSKWREAEAIHAQMYAGQTAKNRAHPAVHQEVIQCEHGGTGVDANHIATDPRTIEVEIAEAVTSESLAVRVVLGGTQILQHRRGAMSHAGERGHEMRRAINRTGGSAGPAADASRRVARRATGGETPMRWAGS